MCYDSYRSDFPGDGTIFHRARVDDQSVGAVPVPKPTVTEDRDRPLSSDSEPPGDTEQTGLVSVARFPVLCTYHYRMIPKLVTDRLQRHQTSQVTSVGRPNLTSGFGKPSTADIHFLHVCSRVRRDEESLLLAGWIRWCVSISSDVP